MQLVATLDTDCYFPFVQGHIIPFILVTFSKLVQFMSQLLNLMFIQIFTRLLKINTVDSERTFYFFAEFMCICIYV